MQAGSIKNTYVAGFTLMEVMIAVAIIGILTAFALPVYTDYVIRANRTDVQSELTQIAQRIQSYKVANGDYTGIDLNMTSIYGTPNTFPRGNNPLYDIRLNTMVSDGLVTGWTLRAEPRSNTVQKNNGVVQLNDLGQKCWSKPPTTCTLSANSNWSGN